MNYLALLATLITTINVFWTTFIPIVHYTVRAASMSMANDTDEELWTADVMLATWQQRKEMISS